ncbi:prephenate dehydratase [Candidatus Albibeggiatoa sp. nov. NOAA]|uniref:prephenate dehydratase n=1 Tax=Candidatus Albibeggiatoa sp. nov. NOAA TaxID=3162724 RepID=UPI0032F51A4A|nr:prephenate dehydratase [Thiotrichaceae bacterium]
MSQDLSAIRQQIDKTDIEIQELLNKRAQLAKQVAQAKYAEEENPTFYRPERENQVLQNVITRNKDGLLEDSTLTLLFREIMSACLALQKKLRVGCLGPEGTYSQAATFKQFGHGVDCILLPTIPDVVKEVEAGNLQYGLVPVENSTEGGINQTLDCFATMQLQICGEVELPINHCLLSNATQLSDIKIVYSHQQSLGQCRKWLETHLPHAEKRAVASNAEAAKLAEQNPDSAAIAGKIAATTYDLRKLEENIEDEPNNTTRFAVISQQTVPPTGQDKTSLLLLPTHVEKAGSLFELLQPLSDNQINMTRIESHPAKIEKWQYMFFIDIEGHQQEPTVNQTIEALKSHAFVKLLGSYPKAIL